MLSSFACQQLELRHTTAPRREVYTTVVYTLHVVPYHSGTSDVQLQTTHAPRHSASASAGGATSNSPASPGRGARCDVSCAAAKTKVAGCNMSWDSWAAGARGSLATRISGGSSLQASRVQSSLEEPCERLSRLSSTWKCVPLNSHVLGTCFIVATRFDLQGTANASLILSVGPSMFRLFFHALLQCLG